MKKASNLNSSSKWPRNLISVVFLMVFAFGCKPKVNKVTSPVTTSDTRPQVAPTPNTVSTPYSGNPDRGLIYPTPIPGDRPHEESSPASYGDAVGSSTATCNSPGVGEQNFEYYRVPIKASGKLQGDLMWSSSVFHNTSKESRLATNSRLHVRVLVKPNPKTCPLPAGVSPPNFDEAYSQLKLAVTVRSQSQTDGGFFEKIEFSDVKVGQCSPVRAFVDLPVTDDPLVLEVRQVQSDFYCLKYFRGEIRGSQYCPYTWIDTKACWEIELHFSTDYTKDIPR